MNEFRRRSQKVAIIAQALKDYEHIFTENDSVKDVLMRELEPFVGITNSDLVRYDLNCTVSRILEAAYVHRVLTEDPSLLNVPISKEPIKVIINPALDNEIQMIGKKDELIARLINIKL